MRPIHSGEVLLEDFIELHGMSANTLAYNLDVTAAHINKKRVITLDTALYLAKF